MMEVSSLLCLPDGLEIAEIVETPDLLTTHVVATVPMRACPLCAEVATHVRSYYTRLVADLPCAGRRVQLLLHVRKFRCDTISCPRHPSSQSDLAPFSKPGLVKRRDYVRQSRRLAWPPVGKGALV
jgi:transposase